MKYVLGKAFCAFFSFSLIVNTLSASSFEDQKKNQMIQDLEVIKHHLQTGYAPAQWKKEFMGWDLDQSFEKAKNDILATPKITTKQFQNILRHFVNSMKDYHVDVVFYSTEEASLPFSVRGAEGRYFIDWIDTFRLPASRYSIKLGDEIVEFGERPIAEVIEELKKEGSKSSNPKTDQRLAEILLTSRSGFSGDIVPKGPILIKTVSSETAKASTCQLRWSYTPEHVNSPMDFLESIDFIKDWFTATAPKPKFELPKIMMANPLHEAFAEKMADRPGGLGARKSFLPPLGEVIWIKEDKEKNTLADLLGSALKWHAYIYRHPSGATIGYIRIPHYKADSYQAKEFGEILQTMEEETDALVIDQLHNFGGIVTFQYEIASMLTTEPLQAPYHRIKITQKEVLEAYKSLEIINLIEKIMVNNSPGDDSSDSSSSDAEEEEGEKEDENEDKEIADVDFGINYQELLFYKAYYELVLDEWNQGQSLTKPTPIVGVDRINPHPKFNYSKPIVMLIDEMDFSGADFVPAILQDNHRALLFGSKTAGAGGYIAAFQFPNTHGIAFCSYTASIAERVNTQKIENLGVTPDIEYQLTVDDLRGGYQGYVKGVNQAVQSLLDKQPSKEKGPEIKFIPESVKEE